MNEQQKAVMHSCVFQGYVEKVPQGTIYGRPVTTFMGYEFTIHLTSSKEQAGSEERLLEIPRHFKVKVYCPSTYREKEEDQNNKIDETLEQSLIPSIHVGSFIEFRGTAYKKSRDGGRQVVIRQAIKTATEIEMDRHYIRIMPPSKESVKRYEAHIKAEEYNLKKYKKQDRKWSRKSWISDRIEDIKKNWVPIICALFVAITAIIIAIVFRS